MSVTRIDRYQLSLQLTMGHHQHSGCLISEDRVYGPCCCDNNGVGFVWGTRAAVQVEIGGAPGERVIEDL